jgi:hypothetical protein
LPGRLAADQPWHDDYFDNLDFDQHDEHVHDDDDYRRLDGNTDAQAHGRQLEARFVLD